MTHTAKKPSDAEKLFQTIRDRLELHKQDRKSEGPTPRFFKPKGRDKNREVMDELMQTIRDAMPDARWGPRITKSSSSKKVESLFSPQTRIASEFFEDNGFLRNKLTIVLKDTQTNKGVLFMQDDSEVITYTEVDLSKKDRVTVLKVAVF